MHSVAGRCSLFFVLTHFFSCVIFWEEKGDPPRPFQMLFINQSSSKIVQRCKQVLRMSDKGRLPVLQASYGAALLKWVASHVASLSSLKYKFQFPEVSILYWNPSFNIVCSCSSIKFVYLQIAPLCCLLWSIAVIWMIVGWFFLWKNRVCGVLYEWKYGRNIFAHRVKRVQQWNMQMKIFHAISMVFIMSAVFCNFSFLQWSVL